jgi:hypothetical protein
MDEAIRESLGQHAAIVTEISDRLGHLVTSLRNTTCQIKTNLETSDEPVPSGSSAAFVTVANVITMDFRESAKSLRLAGDLIFNPPLWGIGCRPRTQSIALLHGVSMPMKQKPKKLKPQKVVRNCDGPGAIS